MRMSISEDDPRRPYTVNEFSQLARLSVGAVYMLIRERKIPATRIGGVIRIPRQAADRLLLGDEQAA
jgi:excisionase family DNA binding protein